MAIKDLKSKRSKFTDNNMLSAATAGELSRAISANENSRVSPDEIKQIKLTNIKIHPDNIYNKNDTEEALYELAQNIKENGLMHNAVVTRRPGEEGYILLSGERRFKAYNLLYNRAKEAGDKEEMKKYSYLPCKIINISVKEENLRRNAEQLYLDTANVFTREGIADSDMFETVSVRYINNLQAVYGLSESEAKKTLRTQIQKQSGRDKRKTIDRNFKLYKELVPELYEFVRNGENEISKTDALVFTEFTPEEQGIIIEILSLLQKSKGKIGEGYSGLYTDTRNEILTLVKNSAEDKKTPLESLQEETKAKIKSRQVKKPRTSADLLRTKYLKNVDSAYTRLKKLDNKTALKQIKRLENSKDQQSILEKLNRLSQLINRLKQEIEG